MPKIQYKRCDEKDELEQILSIQKRNLPSMLSPMELEKEGFLTVKHSLELLTKMNTSCAHIVAKSEERVVGYALCMHPTHSNEIAVLKPMFEKVKSLTAPGTKYMVMGQICVEKSYRRSGIFSGLYNYMRDQLRNEYEMIITEVDADNSRSLGAHYKIGFEDLLVYPSGKRTWHLIKWAL